MDAHSVDLEQFAKHAIAAITYLIQLAPYAVTPIAWSATPPTVYNVSVDTTFTQREFVKNVIANTLDVSYAIPLSVLYVSLGTLYLQVVAANV